MSAIRPGDLVFMAKRVCDCAVCRAPMGIPFVVTEVCGALDGVRCTTTGKIIAAAPVARGFRDSTGHYQIPVAVLKKIDPLPEDERSETDEEIAA